MRHLVASDIIDIWEKGDAQHPLDRAITMLLYACPEMTWEELTNLSVFERDAYLLDLYEYTFGKTLKGYTECPKCKEHLEFILSVSDMKARKKDAMGMHEYLLDLKEDNTKLKFRFPNSTDLAAVISYPDIQTAQNALAKRCIIQTIKNEKSIPENELSSEVIDRLIKYMSEHEHNAEVLINLQCPSCNHNWEMLFDIIVFLWEEIASYAKRLLQEIHCIASVYGWSEESIIAMRPVKRQHYLQMVL